MHAFPRFLSLRVIGSSKRRRGTEELPPPWRNVLRTRDAPPRGWRCGARSGPAQAGEAGVGLETNQLQQYSIQYITPDCLIVSTVRWAHFQLHNKAMNVPRIPQYTKTIPQAPNGHVQVPQGTERKHKSYPLHLIHRDPIATCYVPRSPLVKYAQQQGC